MQFRCPIVAAGGPGGRGGHGPLDAGEVGARGAFPDGEVVSVPAHGGDCVVAAVIEEDSRVGGILLALHWVGVAA